MSALKSLSNNPSPDSSRYWHSFIDFLIKLWYFVRWVIFSCALDILSVVLGDLRSCLNFLFLHIITLFNVCMQVLVCGLWFQWQFNWLSLWSVILVFLVFLMPTGLPLVLLVLSEMWGFCQASLLSVFCGRMGVEGILLVSSKPSSPTLLGCLWTDKELILDLLTKSFPRGDCVTSSCLQLLLCHFHPNWSPPFCWRCWAQYCPRRPCPSLGGMIPPGGLSAVGWGLWSTRLGCLHLLYVGWKAPCLSCWSPKSQGSQQLTFFLAIFQSFPFEPFWNL